MSKALFWDFDGTLVVSNSLWARQHFGALKDNGYQLPYDLVRLANASGFSWHTPELEYPGEAHLWWEKRFAAYEPFYQAHGIDSAGAAAVNQALRQRVLSAQAYALYPDATDILRFAQGRGYKNILLSNNYPELEQVVSALGLRRYFDGCVVSACVGYEKPSQKLFQHALRLAGSLERAIMVGDNPIADIAGGKACGMTTIQVHNPVKSEADYVCAELWDIRQLLL